MTLRFWAIPVTKHVLTEIWIMSDSYTKTSVSEEWILIEVAPFDVASRE